jgi:hypothetical protein
MSDGYLPDENPNRRQGLIDSYNRLGPVKFWSIIVAMLAYAALGIWLQHKVNWPDGFGFHCRGRTCLIEDLEHSSALLRGRGLYELALFAWFWLIPVVAAAAIVSPFFRRMTGARVVVTEKNDRQAQ